MPCMLAWSARNRADGPSGAWATRSGAIVNPGDVIVADMDGVVVVPRLDAPEVARLSAERIAKEQKTRERLRNKELGVSIYGLKARLLELGVRYVEDEKELNNG